MKAQGVIATLVLLMALVSCSTQKKLSAVEAVSTADNSTHSLRSESARLDSVFNSLNVEFDSLCIEVETLDSIPRRMRLQAKRASIGAQSQSSVTLNEVVVVADSTATKSDAQRETAEASSGTAVAKPPDTSLVIIVLAIFAVIVYIYYRRK